MDIANTRRWANVAQHWPNISCFLGNNLFDCDIYSKYSSYEHIIPWTRAVFSRGIFPYHLKIATEKNTEV